MNQQINIPDNFGNTPLHVSTYHGHLDMAKVLLTEGADPTLINLRGKTPLKLAYRFKKVEHFLIKCIIFKDWKNWLIELKSII